MPKEPTEKDYIAINRLAMEYIWRKVQKVKREGKDYIRYLPDDIPYLYQSGLIDTERVSLKALNEFFEPLRGPDGAFYVDHKKIIELGKYRYHKIVGKPFDPLKMRRGKYTLERLRRIFENSLIPSTSLDPKFIWNQFNTTIMSKANSRGEIEFTEEMLRSLAKTLELYPSPRRRLELDVESLRAQEVQENVKIHQNPELSQFTHKTDIKKATVKSLKDVLVKTKEAIADPHRQGKGEVIDIKKLKKPKPGKI
ncbi:MAG: hypothetical protein HYU97_01970 [Deltaproteobacteria bacterium]|nr:hypothetical protein [Deltaproteobacteria bacterium]